ncbi:MAG: hypothetical protein P8Q48_06165 [Paracoccaceae bacterium]|nr:hypothetical protein [Paracoccaceae bacterium]MDG1369814.1 hypothetical protein [Paracoccaceae bacterium]
MQEDDDDQMKHIASYYGMAPMIVGLLFAAGVIWFMFAVADGFA